MCGPNPVCCDQPRQDLRRSCCLQYADYRYHCAGYPWIGPAWCDGWVVEVQLGYDEKITVISIVFFLLFNQIPISFCSLLYEFCLYCVRIPELLSASLYLSASSFKQTTQELIEDEFSHNNPGVVAYYATIMATFPTAISDL